MHCKLSCFGQAVFSGGLRPLEKLSHTIICVAQIVPLLAARHAQFAPVEGPRTHRNPLKTNRTRTDVTIVSDSANRRIQPLCHLSAACFQQLSTSALVNLVHSCCTDFHGVQGRLQLLHRHEPCQVRTS